MVVGNKCDIDDSQRVVSKEEGKRLAVELGGEGGPVNFAETSAKNYVDVYKVFADLVRRGNLRREVQPRPKPLDELSEETLKEAFESADKDKDAQISVSELGMYLYQLR